MATRWLDDEQRAAWVRLAAVLELLPTALDAQLRRDSGLTTFEYFVLAMLSESPGRTLRMSELAQQTSATLSRLSHVVRRMEAQGLVVRHPCPEDRRVSNVSLCDAGWDLVVAAAPGHVSHVRDLVIDALDEEQVRQLTEIGSSLLARLDPGGAMSVMYRRHDRADPSAGGAEQ